MGITTLGVIGYFATGQVSKTALIPCIFGLPVIILGVIGWWRSQYLRATSIAAIVIACLAFGGSVRGVMGLVTLIVGGEVTRPTAVIVQAIMAIASIGYILYGFGNRFGKGDRHQ